MVVVEVVVVVVVVGTGQLGPLPGVGHASQQLVHVPMVPCLAVQCAASGLILHVVPLAVLRQHVTAFGLPQVEWDAHFFTNPTQLLLMRAALACCSAQPTYARCFVATEQTHSAATVARAFAMSARSGSTLGSHLARATRAPVTSARTVNTTRTVPRIGPPPARCDAALAYQGREPRVKEEQWVVDLRPTGGHPRCGREPTWRESEWGRRWRATGHAGGSGGRSRRSSRLRSLDIAVAMKTGCSSAAIRFAVDHGVSRDGAPNCGRAARWNATWDWTCTARRACS
jgi:hypothetical protein